MTRPCRRASRSPRRSSRDIRLLGNARNEALEGGTHFIAHVEAYDVVYLGESVTYLLTPLALLSSSMVMKRAALVICAITRLPLMLYHAGSAFRSFFFLGEDTDGVPIRL